MPASRSTFHHLVAPLLIALLANAILAAADVTVSKPISSQFPQIARVGEAFSWAFSQTTFNSSISGAQLTYTVSGLPSWCSFESSSRSFQGTASGGDWDVSTITVTANDGSSSVADSWDLITTTAPAPTLQRSLVQQLPYASSLGRSQILEGTMLHIPWGWSFSVGWLGDTFTLPDDRLVYTAGTINGFETLPKWLKYSNSTYAMWGIAPTSPPPEGVQFTFSLTGSNEAGYAGTTSNVTIVLGDGEMSLASTSLPTMNVTAGGQLNYTIPYGDILINKVPIQHSDWVNVTADVSSQSWLTFDAATLTFSGTAPDSDSADETQGSVPVTITNAVGTSITTNIALAIFPTLFSSDTLPNVYVTAGEPFNVTFSGYIRSNGGLNITATYDPVNASDWATWSSEQLTISGTAPDSLAESSKVMVTLTDEGAMTGATSSLSRRDGSGSVGSQAAFYIALNGTSPGEPDNPNHHHGLSAAGKKALIAILVILAVIAILVLIFFLARRRKQRQAHPDAVESKGTDSRGRSPAFSEKTLNNPSPAFSGASPAFGDAFFGSKKYKVGQSPLPSPVPRAHSPYLDPKSADNRGILIGGRNYGGPSPEMMDTVWGRRSTGEEGVSPGGLTAADADRPRQHGFMSALVTGAKKKFPSSKNLSRAQGEETGSTSAVAPARGKHSRSESVGLGFTGVDGLEAPDVQAQTQQRPVNQNHSRSRHSLGSSVSKESWEEDLFYGPGEVEQRTMLNPIIEVDEVPRRRGSQRLSARPDAAPMRHRVSHMNASPAFNAPGSFEADPDEAYGQHPRPSGSSDQLTATQSTSRFGSQDEIPAGLSAEYVIGTAQRIDIREMGTGSVTVRTPDLRENHHLSGSSYINAFGTGESGMFDDAEVEPELPADMNVEGDRVAAEPQSQHLQPSQGDHRRKRDSAMDRVSADPALMAMSPYLLYAEQDPRQSVVGGSSSPTPYSPRPPSIFGGASINSTTRPEETLRSVPAQSSAGRRSSEIRSETPPPASAQLLMNNPYAKIAPGPAGPPRYSRSGVPTGRSAYRKIEHIEANVTTGERLRIKLTPAGGAAMVVGAPGSPGKRSSRAGKYLPVLDDESMQAHRTWPLWLSEWLHWDPLMFELSGEIPIDFELDRVDIALVHRKPKETISTTGAPVTAPGSPGKEDGRTSIEVNGIMMVDEVVAKLTLWIVQVENPYNQGQVPDSFGGVMMKTGSAF